MVNYKLLKKQKEFIEIPHNYPLDVAIYQGGFGSGKTWCGSLLGILLAHKYAGSRGLVGAKEYEHQEKLQELCLNVLDTYSKLLLYQKQLDLYTKMLTLEEDNLTLRKRLFEAKEISKIELDDEEIKVNKIKSQI